MAGDVVIIGGGPVGLLTGIKLLEKGFEVEIYEEDKQVGYPQHCTGIVSFKTLELYPIEGQDLIINKLRGVRLRISDKFLEEYVASTPKAIVIDRILLEKRLYWKYIDMGGEIYLDKRMDPKILAGDIKKKNGVVINAGGAKELIKSGYKDVLTGFQVDIESVDKWIKDDVTEIYVDKELNSEYFCWITPLSNNHMRIGTASSERIRDIVYQIGENLGIPMNKVVREFGGIVIAGGPRKKFMDKNIVYVGDSAGMNKITTGGGLNYGGNGAIILTDMLYNEELTNYRSRWIEKFKRELQIQGILRDLFLTMDEDEIVEVMTILSKTEIFNALLATGDMDYHASDLHKLLFERDLMRIVLGKGRFRRILRKLFTKI